MSTLLTGNFNQLKRFLQARFSRDDVLGLHLTLGILVLLAASWLFAAIAEDVVNQERLIELDLKVTRAVQTHASRSLTFGMLVLTHAHSTPGGTLITLVVVASLLRKRLKTWALAFSLSVAGGMLLNVLLKGLFERARPTFDTPILTLTSYSFPSGHTMLATTLYGALCAFVLSQVRGWPLRSLTIVAAASMIALVGFSRIYLGAHYLTDVLAAMLEGLAWLALVLTAIHTRRRWRERRQNR
jgi:undecaprenyl-diphosphatase